MALEDIIITIVVVVSPILFFTVLFGLTYLYRRHRSPFRLGKFREDSFLPGNNMASGGAIWDPRSREKRFPHCHICFEDHSYNPALQTATLGDTPYKLNLSEKLSVDNQIKIPVRRESSLAQPHFQDKMFSIRRISDNPLQTDQFTRVNSFCSSLGRANSSSELLPFEDRSTSSGLSAIDNSPPNRHLSVILDGTGNDLQKVLSVRRVSAGGEEDELQINKVNRQHILSETHNNSGCKDEKSHYENIKPLKLINTSNAVPPKPSSVSCPHPFSKEALQRSSYISSTNIFPIPHIQIPERSKSKIRPSTLKIPSTSSNSLSNLSSNTTLIDKNDHLIKSNTNSNQTLKSITIKTPESKYSIDTCSSFGHDPINSKNQSFFNFNKNWNGFKQIQIKNENNQEKLPKIEIPISPTTSTPNLKLNRKNTISATFRKLNQNNNNSDLKSFVPASQFDNQEDEKGKRRKETLSNASKIIYLADIVKKEENLQNRLTSSIYSEIDIMHPPEESLVRKTGSIVSDKPPELSPLRMEQGLGVHNSIAASLGERMVLGDVEVEHNDEPRAI
ncbi:uncharacterized protein I206_106063 [Kwoniella pini CBS 10737]|uniref:Uncharacterized protein n=1 Tax=Kwoniella pini CBS 10737 TaxID=1296096 RepID=A0A1B9I160_9TREE|nr:uncharacterized protein I206_04886 [Kwoniella pini CBS 10737]OCF49198.1 hypothetical protein I206_04886 [Kwoniella pini CBS 10737]